MALSSHTRKAGWAARPARSAVAVSIALALKPRDSQPPRPGPGWLESGIRLRSSCLQPGSKGLVLRNRLSANDLCRAPTRPHYGVPLRLLARGRLVGALYLASISHVDPIHMGDTSQIQGSNTVVARQVPGVTTGLPGRRVGSGATEGPRRPKTTGAQGAGDGTPGACLRREQRNTPIQADWGCHSPGFVEKHKPLG